MPKQRFSILIDPTWNEMVEREPLLLFSFYLSGRNNILLELSDEIIENLDKAFSTSSILQHEFIDKASTLIWLWTLGAYEVIRTICQAEKCFSPSFIETAKQLKKQLAFVRMPNAKMEEVGKKKPVNSDRSPDGLDVDNKDLLIGDPESPVSARALINTYNQTMTSLTKNDVVGHHSESY